MKLLCLASKCWYWPATDIQGFFCFKTRMVTAALSLNWDSCLSYLPRLQLLPQTTPTWEGSFLSSTCPPHFVAFTSEQFLPLLGITNEDTSFFPGICVPLRVETIFQLEIQILIRTPCIETNNESSLCTNMWHRAILLSVHQWTTSGCILGTLIARLGWDLSGWKQIRKGSSSRFLFVPSRWAMCMYYWVKNYITNIKFIHKI